MKQWADDDSMFRKKLKRMKVAELRGLYSRLAGVLNMSNPDAGSSAKYKETWIQPLMQLRADDLMAAARRLRIQGGGPEEGTGVRSAWIDAIMENRGHSDSEEETDHSSNASSRSALRRDLPDRIRTNLDLLYSQDPQLSIEAEARV